MLKANHTGRFKYFSMLHNLQEYSTGGGGEHLKKLLLPKPVSLTTLNGISFLYRGKPGQFIADPTQVCTLQLLSVFVLLSPLQN